MGERVSYLYEPEGSQLHWDGLKATQPPAGIQNDSLGGSGSVRHSVHPADREGMQGSSAAQSASYSAPPPPAPAPHPEQPKMDHETMMLLAREMLDRQANQHQSILSAGPSTGDRDAAGGKLPEWLTRTMEREDR